MADLRTQLGVYIRAVSPPQFELEEILERSHGLVEVSGLGMGDERRSRRRWLVAVAAGLATIVVVGAAILPALLTSPSDDPALETVPTVDQTPVTSGPATTAAETTTPTSAPAQSDNGELTSPIVWTRVIDPDVLGGDGKQVAADVTVGDGLIVAVGSDWSGGDADAAVWYSEDGSTWNRVSHDEEVFGGAADQRMHGVVAMNPGFVAVGFEGDAVRNTATNGAQFEGSVAHAAVWYSEDGLTWMRVPHDEATFGGGGFLWMNDVAISDSKLVAVGVNYRRTAPFATHRWGDRTQLSPAAPIDIDADAAVWTSADGLEWTRVDPGSDAFGGDTVWQRMHAVAAGGPGFVAVGQEGFDFLGVDDWTPLPVMNTDSDAHVMDNAAAVWISPDGETWTRVAPGPALTHRGDNVTGWATMFDVTVGGPGLVAVGWDVSLDGLGVLESAAVWLSDDGSSWERVTRLPGVRQRPYMVAIAATEDGRLVGGGDGTVAVGIWTSLDGGDTWVVHPHENHLFGSTYPTASLHGLAVFDDEVVAVGRHDTDVAVWMGTWTGASG